MKQATEQMAEVKQVVGAILFAAKQPVQVNHMIRTFKQVAEKSSGIEAEFGKVGKKEIEKAIKELQEELNNAKLGFHIAEVAQGYRLQNDAACGPWLRAFLDKGKATKLSRPALETLAIVAYRQPCVRSEIEAVRGVAVDQILRNLLDMQLIKIAGRSELPGRPWLFATTQNFLEHFGLRSLDDLPGTEELKRMEIEKQQADAKVETEDESAADPENGEKEAVDESGTDQNKD